MEEAVGATGKLRWLFTEDVKVRSASETWPRRRDSLGLAHQVNISQVSEYVGLSLCLVCRQTVEARNRTMLNMSSWVFARFPVCS